MSWAQADVWQFSVNSNVYQFAPTELIGYGMAWDTRVNQVVQEAESGVIKVLTLDDNDRRDYTFRIRRMPWADRTEGSFTIRGMSSLLTMIRNDANYRANTISFWDRATALASSADDTVRFWASNFGIEESQRVTANTTVTTTGQLYFGSGQETITFRREIT